MSDEAEIKARKYADENCTLNCWSPNWQSHYKHFKVGWLNGREEFLAKVLEQINLAQENWDTAESTEAAFDTLRECVAEIFKGEDK